jgi:hypothetical protein
MYEESCPLKRQFLRALETNRKWVYSETGLGRLAAFKSPGSESRDKNSLL